MYSLQYHLVWCTKYRKSVLTGYVKEDLIKMIKSLSREYGFTIIAMEIMPDHVHLLIDCTPQFFIADMMKIIKGNTARWLFIKHPDLKSELWGGHLWNPSYCAITVSERSIQQVTEYINSQEIKNV